MMGLNANTLQLGAGLVLGIALIALWILNLLKAHKAEREKPAQLFAEIIPLLQSPQMSAGDSAGVYKLNGEFDGRDFQFKVIADNLAPRKLPGLWLMVTRPTPLPVRHVFDLMMRPSGPTSFSNFDFLPHNLPLPSHVPPYAVVRSDGELSPVSWDSVSKLLHWFHTPIGKELLISPKGLRLVVLLAEADRLRYGVFRQIDFGKPVVKADTARRILDDLISLENDLRAVFKISETSS